ncbi:MAG: ABC transporter permease [Lachnospiraceae bacterium]|nr:ABC transporter permease [Candidatus Equihabitans merdae]
MERVKKSMTGFLVPVLSIILAFLIGAIIMLAMGASPARAFGALFKGAFGSAAAIGTTLNKATPLIFTALCACFAYKCGVFNLGGEGQFLIGATAGFCAVHLTGVTSFPGILLCLLTGTLAGDIWGLIPGILKITRGLNEMIISIMMNYVATLFMGVIYTSWCRDAGMPQTASVDESVMLPRVIPNMRFAWAFVPAVVVGLLLYYFLYWTSSGFKLRAVGLNMTASRFNGFPVKTYILTSFIVSGAIAGLGGASDLLGTQYRLINGYGVGYGFDGVAMALIGQLHPIATVVVAIFFAALRVGSTSMQVATKVPTSVSDIIQALVIVFSVAGMALTQLPEFKAFMLRLTSRSSGKKEERKEA